MSSRIKIKWLLILVVWAGSFFICFYNVDSISIILDAREKKEILQKDMAFWKDNTDKISGVIDEQRLLSQEVESLKMGMVFLDDTFNRLAAEFNLRDLKMEMDSTLSQDNSMPVNASFKCTLKAGLDAMQQIQTKYTFLPFKSVKIEEESIDKSTKFNISMNYKYHIKDT